VPELGIGRPGAEEIDPQIAGELWIDATWRLTAFQCGEAIADVAISEPYNFASNSN
jgi:hypothetical protein